MIKIFYHISCIGSWESILTNQVTKIIFSGLYDSVESIHCYILGCGNAGAVNKCIELLKSYGNKFVVQKINIFDKFMENFTLSDIKNHITDSTKLLFLHTKGVTRNYNTTYRIGDTYYIIENLYSNIMDWNNVMEYMLIKNYKNCLEELEQYDAVGVNWCTNPNHFSGMFWWTTGKYYLSLPDNIVDNESYIGVNNPKVKEVFNTGLAGYGHYFNKYDMNNYTN